MVYHHRFTSICTIDWLTITPEQFSADVWKHIIIRNEDYDLSPCWNKVPDHWSFGSSWWVLRKRGENKFAGYDYLLWTDANLVRDIEVMICANEVEMAQKILRKLVS